MRTLSDTLLAAQKKPHHLPYVEAKVYDYEAGIKRLPWTRVYEGSEPDNHHGIAFDGQGNMHRIRAGSGNALYYQKQGLPFATPFPYTFPFYLGEPPEFDVWTQIATHCAGPCAIAACGAKVYIFYKTTANVLWKYYSHDYGQTWDDAQLVDYTDVLSLAACWWGTGDIVVCFAATAIKISAIVLDTSTQAANEYYYNHVLDTIYGIGATFNAFWPAIEIVLGGKDTDAGTGIVTYSLYATWLSDTYNFLALRQLISAQEDVVTAFKYPDCHRPATPYDYETLQLTVVEDYSGVTAYTRPLLAHLVKGTYWSSATITEPKPFVDISSSYGLRLITDSSYWWLERPDGVWRAPRPADSPLDLTPYIQQFRQVVDHDQPGSLAIVLDNSKGQYANPGEGELASLRLRSEIALKLGYKTAAGNEAVTNLNYWVDSWKYSLSQQSQPTLTLFCLDLWGLAAAWSARYSLRWNYTAFQPSRVWEILYQYLGRLGIRLWNNPSTPKSYTIDNYYPKFLSRGGTHADTQLRRLLSFVTDKLVPREALCFAKDLLPSESSSYEYKNEPGAHRILGGSFSDKLVITHAQVSGNTQAEPPVHVREAAFDWDLLALGIDNLRMQYDPNLEEADQAQKRADALLRHETLEAMGDHIVVPTNVGQELLDVVEVTDARCGISQEKYRVLAIQTDYDRRQGIYTQRLALYAP